MAKTGGRQVHIGMGIEATAGTAVAETVFFPWTSLSMQAISEKAMFNSARGIRNMSSNSMIRRRYAQGSIGVVPNVINAPYFFGLALGSVSSSTDDPETGANTHTITVQNLNASMKTATLSVEQGAVETTQYTNCVCNTLNIEVSDGYAGMTAELIGQFPGTDTVTESYTEETEFAYHQMTIKFGTSISNAGGQSATPIKSFSLNINNNVQVDEAFLSGANTITAGGLVAGALEITGSYSLHFENTTELAKYKANTKNAAIVAFTGANIGATSTPESITMNIAKLVLTGAPVEYNIDGLLVLNQQFTVEYGATDNELEVVVVNGEDGTDY